MNLGDFRGDIARRLAVLSNPVRILVIAAACIIAAVALFWLLNQVFYYFLARSYVDEIADAYNLNRGFATALLWVSFAAIAALSGWSFSLSKPKRQAGYAGLLILVVAHSIAIGMADRNFKISGQAEKCFVMTRNSVKIMNRTGIDPETGRECRPLTPVMAEKIELYKEGKRPTRILSGNPSFFSALSGEPIVWYAKNGADSIEMFDLMGYHPQTGEELLPVTRDIVALWTQQTERTVKRIPSRVDPNTYGFFDPVTGAAKVWYWRSEAGEYEFYDGPGFHPRAGDPLQVITRDSMTEWKKTIEEAIAKKKVEQERIDRETREKAEREQRERQERVEREQRERQERAEREQRERQERAEAERRAREAEKLAENTRLQAGNDCDRLAANPTDIRRTTEGVPFELLKGQVDQALEACTRAVQLFPNELRYQYQLGRATQFKDRKRALEIFTALTNARYPAAFDNLGGMLMFDKKDIPGAIRVFAIGVSLDDADSMVSLADLVDKGYYGQGNSYQVKWTLLNKAAQLNHGGAQRAVAAEKARADASALEQEKQKEAARMAAEVFGAIIGGMNRR